jgi:hypothetical protein
MVRLGIEFWELELNSNSIYKYRGKKLCLGVEFWDWKILYFNAKKEIFENDDFLSSL